MEDGGGGDDLGGEACGDDDGVVEGWLVGGEEHGVGLAEVHVQGRVGGLHGVGALHLDELHGVALEPDVERGRQPHVGDPEPVRLPCTNNVSMLYLSVSFRKKNSGRKIQSCAEERQRLIAHTRLDSEGVAIRTPAIDEQAVREAQCLATIKHVPQVLSCQSKNTHTHSSYIVL